MSDIDLQCEFTVEVKDEQGIHRERCAKPKNHIEHDFEVVHQ